MKKTLKISLFLIIAMGGLWVVYGLMARPHITASYVTDFYMIRLTKIICVIFFILFISNFIRWTPSRIALIVGVVFSLVLMTSMELIARVVVKDGALFDRTFPDNYLSRDKTGLKIPNPGKFRSVSVSRVTKKVLYDVIYTIDDFGRRVTPIQNKDGRGKFILFLGCSYTYGEGVQDDQTLPAYVGALTDKYMPYNYGFHGRGPHDVLALLDKIDFKKELPQRNGILIYTFMLDHINRSVGSMSIVDWNHDHVYYARNTKKDFERVGTFETACPIQTKLYLFLRKSSFLKLLHVSLPRIGHQQITLTADLINAAKTRFLNQYPQGKFIVNIYPPLDNHERIIFKQMISELKNRNILYLDHDKLFGNEESKYVLSKEDPHPSAFAYKTLAESIVSSLNLNGPLIREW